MGGPDVTHLAQLSVDDYPQFHHHSMKRMTLSEFTLFMVCFNNGPALRLNFGLLNITREFPKKINSISLGYQAIEMTLLVFKKKASLIYLRIHQNFAKE